MRFYIYLVFSFIFSMSAHAQHNHFVYIQTENKQAFYVKLNDKLISSTASGYAIIPKLQDGHYKLQIGFPKNEWPLQTIELTINNKDEGFFLKNFGEKGWGLFNTQTLDVMMGTAINTGNAPVEENKADGFSSALAEVTNSPARQQVVSPAPATVSTDTANAVVKEVKKETPAVADIIKPADKLFSFLDSSGRSVIYTTTDGITRDTVRIFIPYPEKSKEETVKEVEIPVKVPTQPDSIVPGIPIPEPGIKKDSTEKAVPPAVKDEPLKPAGDSTVDVKVREAKVDNKNDYTVTLLNPACKSTATDEDFLKLRKKMAAEDNDEAMIAAAGKGFRAKCFTTDQVKNLSLLFLNDKGKYNFYDAAYSHVTDIGNFKNLQSQLSDEYYITRFKAMLR